MAIRSSAARVARLSQPRIVAAKMEGIGGGRMINHRYFSDGRGRILSEEERAAENVYIQKMEREKMEKLRRKAEKKEKAEAEKEKGSEDAEELQRS